ncbi:hypothetical protein H1R20_g12251, partial [Candolleomyces eurysporus]
MLEKPKTVFRKTLKKFGRWKAKLRSDDGPQSKEEVSKTGKMVEKLENGTHHASPPWSSGDVLTTCEEPEIRTAVGAVETKAEDDDKQVLGTLPTLEDTDPDAQDLIKTPQESPAPANTASFEAKPALDLNLPSHGAAKEKAEATPAEHAVPSDARYDHLDSGKASAQDTAALDDKEPALPAVAGSQVDAAGDVQTPKKSKMKTAWTIATQALRTLNRCADAFPPLKAATSILVEMLDRYDQVQGLETQLKEFADTVDELVKTIQGHRDTTDAKMKARLDGLVRAIEASTVRLGVKVGGKLRFVTAKEDVDAIKEELLVIKYAIQVFMMYTAIETYANVSSIKEHHLLAALPWVPGAEFRQEDRPCCLDGTRINLLADLLVWATALKEDERVFWLGGIDGTGKTTVAETFCRILAQKGLLGGSFFCSNKSQDRRDVRRIFPSLARSLARYHPGYRRALIEALQTLHEYDIPSINLGEQFRSLFVDPLQTLNAEEKDTLSTMTFVVDALDECQDNDAMEQFLEILLDNLESHDCPLKFCVTGRPEAHIREKLTESGIVPSIQLHEIDDSLVEDDIYFYLSIMLGSLKKLRDGYTSWPPPELRALANRAGKLFVYASTVFRYVKASRSDPKSRLIQVLDHKTAESTLQTATKNLHSIYALIFSEGFDVLDDDEQDLSLFKNEATPTISSSNNSKEYLIEQCTYFIGHKFLYWLELLACFKHSHLASAYFIQIQAAATDFSEFQNICSDCLQFLNQFRTAIGFNPAHIYLSALPMFRAGSDSFLVKSFAPLFQNTVKPITISSDGYKRAAVHDIFPFFTFEALNCPVLDVAVSPNGKYLATGYASEKMYIWSLETAALLMGPLFSHAGIVTALLFSADSMFLVSGTQSGMILSLPCVSQLMELNWHLDL